MTPRNPPRATEAPRAAQGPVRTCIGCRGKATRSDLVRLVVSGGDVVIDERRDMPGRGAWVHPDPTCLTRAVERRAIGRALNAPDADASRLTFG